MSPARTIAEAKNLLTQAKSALRRNDETTSMTAACQGVFLLTGIPVMESWSFYEDPEQAIGGLQIAIRDRLNAGQQSQEASSVEIVSPFESLPTDAPGLGDAIAKLGLIAVALLFGAAVGLALLKGAWPDVCSTLPPLCESEETRR